MIGLSSIGLPLTVKFARRFDVSGFDISSARSARLRKGVADTREVHAEIE